MLDGGVDKPLSRQTVSDPVLDQIIDPKVSDPRMAVAAIVTHGNDPQRREEVSVVVCFRGATGEAWKSHFSHED